MEWAPFVAPAVTIAVAVLSLWMGFSSRISKLEVMIAELKADVEKHNRVVERTYKLESDVATQWRRHDELAERVGRLEDRR